MNDDGGNIEPKKKEIEKKRKRLSAYNVAGTQTEEKDGTSSRNTT